MKKVTICFSAFLLFCFFPLKAQELQQIKMYKNGYILYNTNISPTDSITFSNYNVPNTLSGVLINGVVWATCNVDAPGTFASHPSEAGMFYQWNRNVGWSSTDPLTSSDGSSWDYSTPTGDSWEPSPCPAGWRLPTLEEQESLVNSGSFWGELNGVSGRFFGNGTEKVFFPAASCRDYSNGTLGSVGHLGIYWSGTPNGTEYAYYVFFYSGGAYTSYYYRSYGFSVRCVSE